MPNHTLAIASAVLYSLFSYTTFATPMVANQAPSDAKIVSAENVDWGYLNPLRGDKSPGAANLWGDRTKDTATGMLVRFKKGFFSPPHIHNITYRGIVINGLLHNDDPTAARMWMPTGSYWTQPAGEDHITAADGESNLIYLEIDRGPYLVKPSNQAFNNGEAPINLHANNLVWQPYGAGKRAFLWGNTSKGEINGSLIKLPAGFAGQLISSAQEFRAVVITGQLGLVDSHLVDGNNAKVSHANKVKSLAPGSYFGAEQSNNYQLHSAHETILYIRTDGHLMLNTSN
ncbi:DUF4437 domain-containing protein [Thalassotalea euphylliae]|uniref:DUF4437 domain-containing protein n=1 Tax=Thalassotalea euphylliae TaxID=1655234 RepID=A0A3E0TRY7_9GAMM|nr:DUF4437 domain-containing protein [Thalassotalea euphylliae]REL27396.1 DUF4437 domain-containing protein [Thalassotalea euphylliae]